MQIGVHLPHIGRKATPEAVTRAAVQAEELGLADVWVREHVILPKMTRMTQRRYLAAHGSWRFVRPLPRRCRAQLK